MVTYISGIEIVVPCVLISIQGNGGYNRRKSIIPARRHVTGTQRLLVEFSASLCTPPLSLGGAEQRIISSWVQREGSELREMRSTHTLCMYRTRVEPVHLSQRRALRAARSRHWKLRTQIQHPLCKTGVFFVAKFG